MNFYVSDSSTHAINGKEMGRYFANIFSIIAALMLLNFAFANPEWIVISLFSDKLSFIGFNFYIHLPLYAVFFIGIAFGILWGLFREQFNKIKSRAETYRKASVKKNVQRQLKELKDPKYLTQEEVLSLLEDTTKEMKKAATLKKETNL